MDVTADAVVAHAIGLAVAAFGVSVLSVNAVGGIIFVAGGLFALPVVRRLVASSAGVEFSSGGAAGVVVACLIAGLVTFGLSAGGGGSVPGADVSNVSVDARDVTHPDADRHLAVEWNSRAQSAVDPDLEDGSARHAPDGRKYLVVRLRITNVGDREVEFSPDALGFETGGRVHDHRSLLGDERDLAEVTLAPNETHSGWTAFSIPADATSGSLVVDPDGRDRPVNVTFEHDPTTPIHVAD